VCRKNEKLQIGKKTEKGRIKILGQSTPLLAGKFCVWCDVVASLGAVAESV